VVIEVIETEPTDKEAIQDATCVAVGFDADDCTFKGEGLPELARVIGGEELVAQIDTITHMGMKPKELGGIPWEEGFAARLQLLNLRPKHINTLTDIYRANITPYVKECIYVMQLADIEPLMISAGISQAVLPVAVELGIKPKYVYANTVVEDNNGFFTQYKTDTPLSRGKKDELVNAVRQEHGFIGRMAMVGDGHMDMKAIKVNGIKIGFGAHCPRSEVRDASHVYIRKPSFASVAPLILGTAGMRQVLEKDPQQFDFLAEGIRALCEDVDVQKEAVEYVDGLIKFMESVKGDYII
jgi:phosphoserine phosphatase